MEFTDRTDLDMKPNMETCFFTKQSLGIDFGAYDNHTLRRMIILNMTKRCREMLFYGMVLSVQFKI